MSEREASPRCGAGTECREAMLRLWEFLDGELTPERMQQIHQHLEMCQGCFPSYDFQRTFAEFMRRQRECPAPPGLRRKVFQMLLDAEKA